VLKKNIKKPSPGWRESRPEAGKKKTLKKTHKVTVLVTLANYKGLYERFSVFHYRGKVRD
jgi:hypothetical protein